MPFLTLIPAEGGGLDIFNVGQASWIWTLLIFGLALFPMWKIVFGPITRALDDRETAAREAAKAAEAAREETERMKVAIQDDLEQARREAAQQVAEARSRAEAREKEILAAAQAQAEQDRQRAQAEIERALSSAREVLRGEAVALGVDVAQRVLQREFEQADQNRLIDDFRKEITAG